MDDFMKWDFQVEQIVLACYVPRGGGMTVHRNRPSHGLALHTGGVKVYTFEGGRTLQVNKNELIYLPKGSTYRVTARQTGDCYAINFLLSQRKDFEPFVCKVKNFSTLLDYFKSAKGVWETKKKGYILKCKADLYNVLCTMQQEYNLGYIPKSKLEKIQPAVDYIHENYTRGLLSVARLSALCSMTPEYFRSIFKSFYGTSPKSYINNLKITRAKELLSCGMYSVTEAAILSGYTDMSHFSREFKRAVGVSPRDYPNETAVFRNT